MYSRFDIVWPDTLSSSDHPAGVDALSYGLATLVMGEDVFPELPAGRRPTDTATPHDRPPASQEPHGPRKIRRGNHYAQYTRKFSVGNGPLLWVQEYSVTKETGKMLGTLVALAVARMVNLETFIWDMPTGVLRDVWIALSSLADRPGHDCRLERVWVRWHDNSENSMRSAQDVATTSSLTLPAIQVPTNPPASGTPLQQKYGHVEYPTLSILPPMRSLSVLDIDEPSYLEETAVLIERSVGKLRELRIGISPKVYQAEWLKAPAVWSSNSPPNQGPVPGWPKNGGVLGLLFGVSSDPLGDDPTSGSAKKQDPDVADTHGLNAAIPPVETSNVAPEIPSSQPVNIASTEQDPHNTGIPNQGETSSPLAQLSPAETPAPTVPPEGSKRSTKSTRSKKRRDDIVPRLNLETLELERVPLSVLAMQHALDWTRITTLTILRCEGHEKLWRALRREFTPSPTPQSSRSRRKSAPGHSTLLYDFPLKIKHIHTDSVSPYLLLFIKDALAPNSLETLLLHEAPMYDSIVGIDAIYKNVVRNHRLSLRKVLIDSTERSPDGGELATSRWRKWMFTREMVSFFTSGRMPRLRELSMTIHSKDWVCTPSHRLHNYLLTTNQHYFLQRLPNIPYLRALHIAHIAHPIHRDPKELAMQILDIVTIRPEVGISYVGMQSKCYEILEGKRGDKDDDLDDLDTHSEGFVPGGDDWAGSDSMDDDSDDSDAAAAVSAADSHSEASSDDRGSSDGDDVEFGGGISRVAFRLREILFYDDKISIFKARHGSL